jgi:alkylated DNA repair dioxygenase AlkB
MQLFEYDTSLNILPYDGIVLYNGNLFNQLEALTFYNSLLEKIQWQNDNIFIYGKHIITKRKVAWYGNEEYAYTYSKTTKKALPWVNVLTKIKKIVENASGESYNCCLLNLYHNGEEAMGWHSDDEKELKKNATIASLSFGAERKFSFKHKKSKESITLTLENGSILVMKGETQTHWQHALLKTKKVLQPRINLTFRTFKER